MPTTNEILAGLIRVANEAFVVAVAWHVIVGVCLVAVSLGLRVQGRTVAVLSSAPLGSVSVLGWVYRNPFNGAVFASVAIVLAWLALAGQDAPRHRAKWSSGLGTCLIGFAWVYPHFLVGRPPSAYWYGAPLGTIPCPTLALVTGATLVAGGLASMSWRLVLAVVVAFYALFGVLRLGVTLDLVLLLGAVGLFVQYARARQPEPKTRPVDLAGHPR